MTYSLYINGVFEDVLEEIRKAQSKVPGLVCYLQPYSSDAIVKLAQNPPSANEPITLYTSLTSSLPFVSFRATIVNWENKSEIEASRLKKLNEHIQEHQPREEEIYMVGGNEKPSVNLLSVVNVERLAVPVHVSNFVKLSNKKPLKPRTTSGGWAYVNELPQWIGSVPESAVQSELNEELDRAVEKSLNSSSEARKKRLAESPTIPEEIQTISKGYRRNPDVIAEVLERANGHCERCNNKAPFIRVKDGSPYLEVHHKKMLSQGGEDTVDNAIATCPNCHRELHYGL